MKIEKQLNTKEIIKIFNRDLFLDSYNGWFDTTPILKKFNLPITEENEFYPIINTYRYNYWVIKRSENLRSKETIALLNKLVSDMQDELILTNKNNT